jgi:hypothetical protein
LAPAAALAKNNLATNWVNLAELAPAQRALAAGVLADVTLQREYPPRRFAGEARHFAWLLDDMVACSTLAHHLGYIQYRVTVDDRGRAWADNREGARGTLTAIHAAAGKRVFYVEGVREGLFEARGRGVTVVDFQQVRPVEMEYRAAAFVRVDNPILAVLARMFRIFLTSTVDDNFGQVLANPIRISELAQRDPAQLRALIVALPPADRSVCEGFVDLLGPGR